MPLAMMALQLAVLATRKRRQRRGQRDCALALLTSEGDSSAHVRVAKQERAAWPWLTVVQVLEIVLLRNLSCMVTVQSFPRKQSSSPVWGEAMRV
jgi:hypothetical protein